MRIYYVYEVWLGDKYCGYFFVDEYDMAVAYAKSVGGEVRENVRFCGASMRGAR